MLFAIMLMMAACNGITKKNKETTSNMKEEKVIYLARNEIKVGLLPDVGGRIVHLSTAGSENVLKSDPDLWNEPEGERPKPTPDTGFKAYNGHIVWLGPQSEWWLHQDVNPALKEKASPWPPDPYLIYGHYKTIGQTDHFIVLQSPESPITGMQLTKKIELRENGEIYFEVTGKNTRDEDISWDLWLNTRLDGYQKCYVPVGEKGIVRMDSEQTAKKDTMLYEVVDGYFTFLPQLPSGDKKIRVAKAFLYPARPLIAAFTGDALFMIHFDKHVMDEIHPEQALVEIYNAVTPDDEDALLELEYHAPYKTLKPGESMKAHEIWQVFPYDGGDSEKEQLDFLKEKI
jgi:hypothetical protein